MKRARLRSIPSFRRHQQGYMLMAVALSLILMTGMLAIYAKTQRAQRFDLRAQAEGAQAGQFATGLRGYMAYLQVNPSSIPGGTLTGVNWLKPPGCGGLPGNPDEGYVPCSFTGGTFGPQYQTRFTYVPATNFLTARTSFVVPMMGEDAGAKIRYANRIALAAIANRSLPNNGIFFNAFSNVAESADAQANPSTAPGMNAGRVLLVATNVPSNDLWLRTDGTNQMRANLNMGGMSIGNARDASFSGNVLVSNQMQVGNGLTVTSGIADLRGGTVTTDVSLTNINQYASRGIYDSTVYTGSAFYDIAKQNCGSAGNSPGIYAVVQATGTPSDADSIYEARVDVTDTGSAWHVTPVLQATNLTLSRSGVDIVLNKTVVVSNPSNMRILVMRRCR